MYQEPLLIHKSILIPDGESPLLIFVVNCLAEVSNIKIYIMSSVKSNSVRYSRYNSNYRYYPKTDNDAHWIQQINDEVKKHKIDVIVPIYEIGISRIIKNNKYLDKNVKLVPLPDLETFQIAINKYELIKHCRRHHIPIPDSFLVANNRQSTSSNFGEIDFPVIIKPIKNCGEGRGIFSFNTSNELILHLQKKTDHPILVQKYIKGYDIDCSVLAKEGKIVAYTIQQGNLPGSNPYKPHLGLEFKKNDELFEIVKKLIASLHWNGIVHIDMRYDQENDQYVVIEMNPRFWTTVDASHLMGVNFPYLSILQALEKDFPLPTYRKENYLSLKGFVKMSRKNLLFLLRWKYIIRNTQLRYVIVDPIPTIYKFVDRTKNIIMAKFKNV